MGLDETLRGVFKLDTFRPVQREVCEAVLRGVWTSPSLLRADAAAAFAQNLLQEASLATVVHSGFSCKGKMRSHTFATGLMTCLHMYFFIFLATH